MLHFVACWPTFKLGDGGSNLSSEMSVNVYQAVWRDMPQSQWETQISPSEIALYEGQGALEEFLAYVHFPITFVNGITNLFFLGRRL
jgi:hypothetical protein